MVTIPGLNILFWLLLWGAMIRTFELKFQDSDNAAGKAARALAVIY
jgi:hypothetical protein